MKAEIVSTGSELTDGRVLDINAAWISSRLTEIGIQIKRSSIVSDNREEISDILREAAVRSDLVIVTGGLGPTGDDRTAEAAAEASEDILVTDRKALDCIKTFFRKRNRDMPLSNEKQARLPSKSSMIDNLCGTAPGFFTIINSSRFYFMPGVPSEMRQMFNKAVLPDICKRFKVRKRLSASFTLFGIAEAQAGETLQQFNEVFPSVFISFRANFPIIEVNISSDTDSGDEFQKAKEYIAARLESKVISDRGLSMAQEVARLLTLNRFTVAVAESCTGGLVSDMLTDVPGSSAFFLLSAVTYSNTAKTSILGVKEETIALNGAVHETTVLEMARNVKQMLGADFGLSISGVAGPSGGTGDKPVGTVCIGIASPKRSNARRYCLNFYDREKNKQVFASTALNMLKRELQNL